MIELSRSKLEKLGFEWSSLHGDKIVNGPKGKVIPATFQVLDDDKGLLAMLEALRKDKLARFLAEPTLVGVSGRPMSFQSGGEIPVTTGGGLGLSPDQRMLMIGTLVDLVPLVTQPDKIRLELRVTVTELAEANNTNVRQHPLPKTKTLHVDTGVEMNSGQTVVMSGFCTRDKDHDETLETLVLITSEIVDASFTAGAAPIPSSTR